MLRPWWTTMEPQFIVTCNTTAAAAAVAAASIFKKL